MSTSSIGTVLDELVAGWGEVPELASVSIYSAPCGDADQALEWIELDAEWNLTEEAAAMGGTRQETWTGTGNLAALRAVYDGNTESTIQAVRARCLEIFAAIEKYVNDTYTGDLPGVEVTAGKMTQGYTTEGRGCFLDFTLTVTALKNP